VSTEMACPTLASRVQHRLARLYGVESPPVDPFVRVSEERECVFVRKTRRSLELRVHLPEAALQGDGSISVDLYCQVVEGVSHFVQLVERARRGLPTTQLELELQAEVDKFVMLPRARGFSDREVSARLFDEVTYAHDPGTTEGDRYRLANRLAAQFVSRLRRGPPHRLATLRRFFGAGQREKLEMVMSA
jgi:hypothetical protein